MWDKVRRADDRLNSWYASHEGPWWLPAVFTLFMWFAVITLLGATDNLVLRASTGLFIGMVISVPASLRASFQARTRQRSCSLAAD